MSVRHPAQKRKALRDLLAIDRTLTTVQLERLDLLRTAEQMGLTIEERTCRTRVTQPGSQINLKFVLADPAYRHLPSATLMHWAGVAETRRRLRPEIRESLRHIDLSGRQRCHLPDAEVEALDHQMIAVEFDAGYSMSVVAAKLRAAHHAGYAGVFWGTSIRMRPEKVAALAQDMRDELPGLSRLSANFVDFWSPGKPYGFRPYSDRPLTKQVTLHQARASGSGARVGR